MRNTLLATLIFCNISCIYGKFHITTRLFNAKIKQFSLTHEDRIVFKAIQTLSSIVHEALSTHTPEQLPLLGDTCKKWPHSLALYDQTKSGIKLYGGDIPLCLRTPFGRIVLVDHYSTARADLNTKNKFNIIKLLKKRIKLINKITFSKHPYLEYGYDVEEIDDMKLPETKEIEPFKGEVFDQHAQEKWHLLVKENNLIYCRKSLNIDV